MNNMYNSLRQLALVALLAGTASATQAQALNYPLANAQNVLGTYTDLGTTGTVITTSSTDDANSAEQTIGFNFPYNGATMDRFVLNTNGFLKVGTAGMTVPAANLYTTTGQSNAGGTLLSTGAANVNLLSPFNFDLVSGTSPAEYRMATTGTTPNRICTIQWKNVSDKAIAGTTGGAVVPTQYTNMSFQVKLYENGSVEFVYGTVTPSTVSDDFKYVQIGIRGSGSATSQILRVTKGSVTAWNAATILAGAVATGATGAFNIRSTVPADNGRTFRFVPTLPNDAGVSAVYTLTRLAVPGAAPHAVSAVVRNNGTNALSNITATLNVTGANTFINTQSIASLAAGAAATVTFAPYTSTNQGNNTVTVSLTNDDNNFNNTSATTQVVNRSTFSYSTVGVTATSASGFAENTEVGLGAKYTLGSTQSVSGVSAFVFDATPSGTQISTVGQTLYGVLVNPTTGAILARSPDFVVGLADANAMHRFLFPTPVSVPAGDILVGMVQVSPQTGTGERYFPFGIQPESPLRPGTFFQFDPINGGAPIDVSTSATPSTNRYMIDAVIVNTVSATSEALKRAVSVYPNPSTSGVFTLEVRGANAKQGLNVEVTNLLGQRLFVGKAQDNFTNTVDLSSLPTGIYSLKVRNGEEYTMQQISIVK
ncbi:MAG: hypothetical protein JWR44_3062 [Hymenobacter sp.]|nr:hypothetical protein [Hymenobacter sp.]